MPNIPVPQGSFLDRMTVTHHWAHFVCSAAQSCPTLRDAMDCSTPGFPVLHYLLEFSQIHVNWVHDTIQQSHPLSSPFPSCFQSFPASRSFPVSQLFTSGGKSIGVSASTSVLSMNIQGWLSLGLTGLILLSKGLSRVFSSITVKKHQFFSPEPALGSNSHIHTWPLEKQKPWLDGPLLAK